MNFSRDSVSLFVRLDHEVNTQYRKNCLLAKFLVRTSFKAFLNCPA